MKCSICKDTIHKGLGKMFVGNDGKIFYFCSSKCQKNWKLGRSPKKLRWISRERKEKK